MERYLSVPLAQLKQFHVNTILLITSASKAIS